MIWIDIPRCIAAKIAEMKGYEVRFGVWMKMLFVTVVRRWRRRMLRGVGGGGGWSLEKKWGFRW